MVQGGGQNGDYITRVKIAGSPREMRREICARTVRLAGRESRLMECRGGDSVMRPTFVAENWGRCRERGAAVSSICGRPRSVRKRDGESGNDGVDGRNTLSMSRLCSIQCGHNNALTVRLWNCWVLGTTGRANITAARRAPTGLGLFVRPRRTYMSRMSWVRLSRGIWGAWNVV